MAVKKKNPFIKGQASGTTPMQNGPGMTPTKHKPGTDMPGPVMHKPGTKKPGAKK
jgi:hypothetical protein